MVPAQVLSGPRGEQVDKLGEATLQTLLQEEGFPSFLDFEHEP